LISSESELKGLKVTVMGLGLHGGGLATAKFLASRGALVTVTDLRSLEVLKPSVNALRNFEIEFVLGEHRMADFSDADLVIKNPAVPPTSPFLKAAKAIETDISLFLSLNKRPVLAITGSKGKSTTSSALHHIFKSIYRDSRLGGNITVSPLTFLQDTSADKWNVGTDPVVLELSSWQLADVAGKGVLNPKISAITNILKDHQDRYGDMNAYVEDKTKIFREQLPTALTLYPQDDPWGSYFQNETPAKPFSFSATPQDCKEGAWLTEYGGGMMEQGHWLELLPEEIPLPGAHNRLNCLIAATMARLFGTPVEAIREALSTFTGIGHRMELVRTHQGIRYYNDSAATIPDAVAAALTSFQDPIFLITGGTDKDLDFGPLRSSLDVPAQTFILDGTAFKKFEFEMDAKSLPFIGPLPSLKEAFDAAVAGATKSRLAGEKPVVMLSPGCASFGMFLNEFDRGRQFIQLVKELE